MCVCVCSRALVYLSPSGRKKCSTKPANKQQYYKTKDSYIAFVVLRLHRQLKVVSEGTLLILSKSSIEHAEEPLRRTRVGCVCQQRAQHKCKVRTVSRVAPPPIRQRNSENVARPMNATTQTIVP